jgi:hypothetical protein
VAIDLGLSTTRTGFVSPGSVSASTQWGTVSARLRFMPASRSDLLVFLGARGTHFAAASQNYFKPARADFFIAGAAAAAEWRQTLVAGLFVALRLEAQVRPGDQVFSVDAVGPVLTVPAWGFSAVLGAGWVFQ